MSDSIILTEAAYYILLALIRPNHSYGIMQEAERLSEGRVRLAAGTLYGAVNNRVEKKWIRQLQDEPGSRKKQYVITQEGRGVLEEELARLQAMVSEGLSILQENEND